MFIHFVRFTTPLPQEQVRRIFEERAPRYREVPRLLQKYYGYKPSSGAFCGCYVQDPGVPLALSSLAIVEGRDSGALRRLANVDW
jgi:hypothetical protein